MTTSQKQLRSRDIMTAMEIGSTKVIFDRVVTRWGADAFEVDTWGRAQFTSYAVAWAIANDKD